MQPPIELIHLAHAMAEPAADLCILAEGNVSCSVKAGRIWIKGSGQEMREIGPAGFACVDVATILEAVLSSRAISETAAREVLNKAKVDAGPAVPSTETYMHASLLARTGRGFVAHGHPAPLLSLLTLPEAEGWATKRLFPDEIVLCGPASCWIPYVAPGLPLAREIEQRSEAFRVRFGIEPKSYWLQNHGLIVVGQTAREAEAGALMAVKAARVLLGALQTGKEVRFLDDLEVDQIYNWPDEHARQKALWN